jgi:hypothetical protein
MKSEDGYVDAQCKACGHDGPVWMTVTEDLVMRWTCPECNEYWEQRGVSRVLKGFKVLKFGIILFLLLLLGVAAFIGTIYFLYTFSPRLR